MLFIGIINAFQIRILNLVFTLVSVRLNEWENHATQDAFDDAFVIKSFTFKLVNSFYSLYYIAFMAKTCERASRLNDENILTVLRVQLISLFSVALIIQNFQELAVPLIIRCFEQV